MEWSVATIGNLSLANSALPGLHSTGTCSLMPLFPQPAELLLLAGREAGERQGVFEHAWSVAATLANYCCGCVARP